MDREALAQRCKTITHSQGALFTQIAWIALLGLWCGGVVAATVKDRLQGAAWGEDSHSWEGPETASCHWDPTQSVLE